MDAFQVNHNWHCIENESAEQPPSPEPPGICDDFRDLELLPRIGDQYQVEIPSLMTDSAYHSLAQSHDDSLFFAGTPHDFLVGLPISLMWIDEKGGSVKCETEEFPGEMTRMSSGNEPVKSETVMGMKEFPEAGLKPEVEPMDIAEYDGTEVGKSAKSLLQRETSISSGNELVKSESITGMQIFPGADLKPEVGPMDIAEYDSTEVGKSAKALWQQETSISSGNELVKSESIMGMQKFPEADLKPEVEPLNTMEYNGTEVGQSAKSLLRREIKNEMHQKQGGNCYCMVPGSLGGRWNDVEEASFLLGLYIFGKNLVQVEKFVESKKMGDILSFYYGKFYRSDRYRKWSECRKMRRRRCRYGQRIFTGSRHQELLSRLLSHVSEECQNSLVELAKTFGEGKMLLEEYVFTMKATVGLNALVEAVGIGKGKQDLTGIAMEPQKSSPAAPIRPEIPIGKACSTLTPLEIINFLTGGYRLSKARSNDIFWEAVWPRLLARGWHSEQPNDSSCTAASRHSLVFLIPGIKKFSRRKLVKGNHYFDSVSDVLNKVASDPALLELDIGADSKEENGWTSEANLDQVDFLDQQRRCYLKPRIPSRGSDVMKFTIVDTSLADERTSNVRELRSLPAGVNFSASRSDSEDSEGDYSEEPTDESDSTGNLHFDGNKTITSNSTQINFDNLVTSGKENLERDDLNQSFPINGSSFINVLLNIPKDQKSDKCESIQSRKESKGHLIRRTRPSNRKILNPDAKQLVRLTACGPMEASSSTIRVLVDPSINQDEIGCAASNVDFAGNAVSLVDLPQDKLSSPSPLSRGSPNISDGCTLSGNSSGADHCCEKTQSRTLIDLNLPLPLDAESESLMMEMVESQDHTASMPPEDHSAQRTSVSVCDSSSEQHSNLNSRRHSTRNRPLTAKALEALACGFLSIKQKRKSRDDFPLNNRSSRHARSRARITEDFNTGITDFKGDGGRNGECKSNDDMIPELQI